MVVFDFEMNDIGEACYVLGVGINKNQLKNSEPKRITFKRSLSYFEGRIVNNLTLQLKDAS